MLRKDEMAVELARIIWMLDMHLETCEKATKAELIVHLSHTHAAVKTLTEKYSAPRARKTKAEIAAEQAEAQRAEAEANGQTTVEEAIQQNSE